MASSNWNSGICNALSVILIVIVLDGVKGFSVGVPPLRSVCSSMNPQHHDYVSQGSDPPFEVSVNTNEVSGGDNVEFTLKQKESVKTQFIGFYVQARDDNDSPIGTWMPNKDTKVHSCGGIRANAAHHASGNVKKNNVTVFWTAPREFQGEVVFTATVLRDFVTYWVYQQTDPVNILKTEALPFAPPNIASPSPAFTIRRPSGNSIISDSIPLTSSTSNQYQPQLPQLPQLPLLSGLGDGIRQVFQNIQLTANSLGRIWIPPQFRLRNNPNASSGSKNTVSASTNTSSSLDEVI